MINMKFLKKCVLNTADGIDHDDDDDDGELNCNWEFFSVTLN